jgi:thiamine pyrophosphate-dependent acetolactate synthase large subunit-like protein
VGTVLAPTDYERAAEGLGALGRALGDASRVDDVLREAMALARLGRPVYVNARIGRTDFRKGSISM